jgi:hypothetical protein
MTPYHHKIHCLYLHAFLNYLLLNRVSLAKGSKYSNFYCDRSQFYAGTCSCNQIFAQQWSRHPFKEDFYWRENVHYQIDN